MFWSARIYLFIYLFIYLLIDWLIDWLICMYACYQLFSKTTGPNCMKFSWMICHHPRTNRLDFGSDQVKGQGQGHEVLKNYWRDDLSSKDQSIRFWELSGQRSRSQKKMYFCDNSLSFWPCGVAVSALTSHMRGAGFDSRPGELP